MKNVIWRLFLLPSTYGLTVWVTLLFALNLDFVQVNVSMEAYLVYFYVVLCFAASTRLSLWLTKNISAKNIGEQIVKTRTDLLIFCVSTVLGLFGLLLYVYDFSKFLGGIEGFILAFFINPLTIRELAYDETSAGFQLSYFSWISIYFCLCYLICGRAKNRFLMLGLVALILIQFSLNLMFIDRTRPITIFLVCALSWILLKAGRISNPLKPISYVVLGPLLIFFAQALFSEKFDKDAGLFNNFLVYLLGSFGYFSALIEDFVPRYEMVRTFYPLSKIVAAMGFPLSVPSQILEFKSIPFLTNVGTFMESLYMDGGLLFVYLFVPIIIFGIDILGICALKSRTLYGLYFWAMLISVNLFSFFGPKFNAVYFYLFGFIFMLSLAGRLRPFVVPRPSPS